MLSTWFLVFGWLSRAKKLKEWHKTYTRLCAYVLLALGHCAFSRLGAKYKGSEYGNNWRAPANGGYIIIFNLQSSRLHFVRFFVLRKLWCVNVQISYIHSAARSRRHLIHSWSLLLYLRVEFNFNMTSRILRGYFTWNLRKALFALCVLLPSIYNRLLLGYRRCRLLLFKKLRCTNGS